MYREFSRASGIGLVAVWDDLTVGGLRDPRYNKDDVHLTPESAFVSLRRLQEQLDARDRASAPASPSA